MAEPKNPGRPRSNNITRQGWASPGKFGGWDDPTEVKAQKIPPAELARRAEIPAPPPPAAPPPAPAPALRSDVPPADRPQIEVVVVRESRSEPSDNGPWRAVEIWTRNRIYGLDASLVCIEVIDRASGRREAAHSLLGARLGGGQRRDGAGLALSHPFPVPGTDAVFKHQSRRNGHYGQTSKVERVVLRVRVTQVALVDAEPAWEEITGSHSRARLENNGG